MPSCWTGWRARRASWRCSSGWPTRWQRQVGGLGQGREVGQAAGARGRQQRSWQGCCVWWHFWALLPVMPCHCLPAWRLPTNQPATHLPSPPVFTAAAEPEGSGAREDAEAAVTELRAAPKPLEVLYNDFAVPSQVGTDG